MAVIEIAKIQVRRGQELQTGIPQLDAGEFGFAQDTEHLYIGKRISEGAPDDNNTRILTENDLNYFQTLYNKTTGTVAAVYRYRQEDLLYTTSTTIQAKLDSLRPSLIDFGVIPSTNTNVQIDIELQNAINDIFINIDPSVRRERRRVLEIPAGTFVLNNSITIPPYTRLAGAGPGLTKILFQNSATSMFKTVDAAGNTFETGNMSLTTGSCRDIVIEGMTLSFNTGLSGAKSLISIDNVENATIRDMIFQTEFDSESTTTYGIVSYGIGVSMRGQGDNGTEKCKNISLDKCQFNGLLYGVLSTGTVVTPSVRNSIFSNLHHGILSRSEDSIQGPINGYFAYNRFTDILYEAIKVDPNPNGKPSNHLSTQNHFSRVGGANFNEFSTSGNVTPVIGFYAAGNKTVDDYFARKVYAEGLSDYSGFYYHHYVKGLATIVDSSVYTKNVSSTQGFAIASTNTVITIIPINTGTQNVKISYQLSSANQSRTGVIAATLDSFGNVGMTDTYNYTETLAEDLTPIIAEAGSGVDLLVVSTATYPRFATVQTSIGNWFLTGSDFPGQSAIITSVVTSGSSYLVTTDSQPPGWNFNSAGTWTLLTFNSVEIASNFNNTQNIGNNFVTFFMNNPNSTTNFVLNYQVEIQV